MLLSTTLRFYKKPEIRKLLVEYAKDKEVAVRFQDYFGKRPDTLMYTGDILELAKKKATSFHCSEELWKNPLQLRSDIKKQEMNELRKGWDLILDIDCPHWPLSKVMGHLFIKALKAHGLKSITAKFSGNKGFHIAVPFEAFPEKVEGKNISELFPEAPHTIARYLMDFIRQNYNEVRGNSFVLDKKFKLSADKVKELTGKPIKNQEYKAIYQCEKCGKTLKTTENKEQVCLGCGFLMTKKHEIKEEHEQQLDPFELIEVDTILIAPRHLYRMPYSIHEKSGLVSVPINPENILKFSKEQAKPENVTTDIKFLDRNAEKGEATKLFINAYDSKPDFETKNKEHKEFTLPEEAIKEELFPPCIKLMLEGMKDGKKRTLFTLSNFYTGAGWTPDAIEQRIEEWNKQNPEPLKEVYLKGQLRQIKKKREVIPPHNCKRYYQDLGVCKPDSFCSKIKNPLQYAKLKHEMETKKGGRKKLTEKQKEARRKFRKQKHDKK